MFVSSFNPNCAEILCHLIHAGGGGPVGLPLLYPVIAAIKGQNKKQMIKVCKKKNFERFFKVYMYNLHTIPLV